MNIYWREQFAEMDAKRKAARLTNEEWASQAGVEASTIDRWRKGVGAPSLHVQIKLKDALQRLIVMEAHKLRELQCRRTLEAQGLTVKRFWIDDKDLGHAETEDTKGRVFLFHQKAKQQ